MRTTASKQPLNPGPACSQFATLLPLLDTGELAPEEAAATRAHLSGCRWCQRQLGEYATVERALRQHLAALEAAFPAFSAQEVIAMVEQENVAPSPVAPLKPARRPRRVRRFLAWAGPLAAVLVIILLTAGIFSLRGRPATSTATPAIYVNTTNGIAALRQSDGKLLWQDAIPGNYISNPIFAPISDHGMVYLIVPHHDGSYLIALRASDGQAVWQTAPDRVNIPVITVANGIVYMATGVSGYSLSDTSFHPMLRAFRGSDGTLLWQFTPSEEITSAPLVSGDTVYFGAGRTLVALRAQDGTLLWQKPLNLAPVGVAKDGAIIRVSAPTNEWLAADATTVYVYTDILHQQAPGSTIINGTFAQVFARRASDGAALWQADLGTDLQNGYLPPVIVNHVVYVAAANIQPRSASDRLLVIFALQDNSGGLLWKLEAPQGTTQDYVLRAFASADGTLYYNKPDGSLNALRLSNNQQLWSHPFPRISSAMILGISGSAVFVETEESIQALSASDGHVLWQQSQDHLK